MKYYVTLAEREYEVLVEGGGDRVLVNGRNYRTQLRAIAGTPLRHLMLDGRSLVIAAEADGPGRWTLSHEGEAVTVEVVDERRKHLRMMIGAGRTHQAGGVVKAPMPGLVVRVLVEQGQAVTTGAGLVVLEAMKMENELKAGGPSVVARVLARPGQVVEKGEVLVELEEVGQSASGT